MSIESKEYFYEENSTPLIRGDRFLNEHKPSEETLRKFNDSKVHKTPVDRAKEDDPSISVNELSGHVVAATDSQAKSNQGKKSDRTLVVQPSQLPTVIAETENQEYTVSKLKADYTNDDDIVFDDVTTTVEVDSSVSTRSQYKLSQKATYKTFLGNFIASFNDIVEKIKALKSKQDTQQGQIDGLVAASGSVGDLINQLNPVGTTLFHLSPQSLSSEYWGIADGATEYPKYVTPGDPGSGETTGYAMLKLISGMTSDGADTNNYVITSFDNRVPLQGTGDALGGQSSWYVTMGVNDIPRHRHGLDLKTGGDGAHSHTVETAGGSAGPRTKISRDSNEDFGTETTSTAGNHQHIIEGDTEYVGTSTTSKLSFDPPHFNGKWVVKIK
jgi:hypothetical protein